MTQSRSPLRAQFAVLLLSLLVIASTNGYAQKDFRVDAADKYHRFTVAGTGYIPIYNLTNQKLHLHFQDQTQSYIVVETGNGYDFDTSRYTSVYQLYVAYGYSTNFHRNEIVIYDASGSDTIVVEGVDTSATNLNMAFHTQNEALLTFHHNRTEGSGWINFESYSDTVQHATLQLTQSGSAFWLDSNYLAIPRQTSANQPGWTGVKVHYRRTGNAYDTAYLTVGSWTNGGHHTFLVSAIADSEISEVDLRAPNVGFGAVTPHDTVCKDFVVTNPSDQTVTIDSLVSVAYSKDDFTLTATLPITLHGHSSVNLHACLAPGTTWDTLEGRRIYVYYTDSLGLSSVIYGDLIGHVVKCVGLSPDSLQFGSTIVGGAVTKTITITNNMHDSATIGDSVVLFGTTRLSFPNGDPFPLKLAGGESRTFEVTLTDTAAGWEHAQLLLYPRDSAGNLLCASTNELIVHVLDGSDTSALSIFNQQQEFLPIVSDLSRVTKVFTFVNDADDSIKVVSATLVGSSGHFSITNIAPSLSAILPHSGRLQVTVQFDADTNGIYRDTLMVVTDNALMAYYIPIVGSRTNSSNADVRQANDASPSLGLYPNPALNEVRLFLSGATATETALMDLLGHSILTAESGSLNIKGLSTGHYIVRVTGRGDDGKTITRSRMLEVK